MVIEDELATLRDRKNLLENSVRNGQLSPEARQIIADSPENDAISYLSSIRQRIANLNNVAQDLNLTIS